MAFPSTYHADSDADDEYERSVIMTSPHLPTDSEASPTDSEPPSTEPTPTTYGNLVDDHRLPRTIITEWTAEECANFISGLGLSQYAHAFLDNEIVGEALIALRHEELKEMGMASVGHRLTILKNVYDVKVQQDIPIEQDHYVPLSADANAQDATVTQDDIARIIQSIRLRDERIVQAEAELRKITEEYRRLREELLPVFRMAKDRSQPLPILESHGHEQSKPTSPPIFAPEKVGSGLSRKFSTKKLFLGATPKNASPTHLPQSIQEAKTPAESASVDPSAAAVAASSHLTASMNGYAQSTSPNQISQPSPTSPAYGPQSTLASRSYSRNDSLPSGRYTTSQIHEDGLPPSSYNPSIFQNDRDRGNPTPGSAGLRRGDEPLGPGSASGGGSSAPGVEIFKSFRVSMEDPCHKVLPAALKKYKIDADWRQYALYIVYGDQERCLGLDERPLILFKQLDKEGRKPMFMLRKHTAPIEEHPGMTSNQPGSAGLDPSQGGGMMSSRAGQYQSSIQLPGGVL
ncbi:RA-domain-containing protein [Xylona heveae TC161]|uniref:RA-domain-containing protein n=1 Tax=Xylona heveae (strain CBS 132557 / TC161) TaxID=1328760 RepID=A0A165K3W4_XYLHT|nr:RA-domain-containing protein [Xylona heveae TC161]KZF26954.1 RA-domain-containing protein [Xylona heveae TC161]